MSRARWGAAIAVWAMAAQVWGAQPQAEQTFAESIEVSVVNVEVVVRDRAGRQVVGLGRDDFALFEDGKRVEISNFLSSFDAVRAPAAAGGGAGGAGAHSSVGAGAPGSAAEGGAGARRERLYLSAQCDNANIYPFDRNRLLKQLRGFLQKTLGADDQVLLVTHDLGLHVRHPFRAGLSSLGAELDRLEKDSARGITAGLNARHTLEQIRDNGCARADESESLARGYAASVMSEVKITYGNLHHLLESLGGLGGRKVLLYVGDGVPTRVGGAAFGLIEELWPTNGGASHRRMRC